jgi:16S rRNA (guanine(527)-N(7))-methyltransferase RsmG
MFHVKHRAAQTDAEALGEAVRSHLEQSLNAGILGGFVASFPQKIGTFAAHLSLWGQKMNLTAAPDDATEILYHVMDSLEPAIIAGNEPTSMLGRIFGESSRLMDIGSGAGFPGLILAAATNLETVLIESRRKRANFLATVAAAMDLCNVTVLQTRVTPENVPDGFDLVTVRAVGFSREFFPLASAALRPGGIALAYLSEGQYEGLGLDRDAAARSGLVELLSPHYDLSRGEIRIARVLGLWRKEN